MANQEHIAIPNQGVGTWNTWREEHTIGCSSLSEADMRNSKQSGAELSRVNFRNANLYKADGSNADLHWANFSRAVPRRARLCNTDPAKDRLIETYLKGAFLKDCSIYGIFCWNTQLAGAKQENYITSHENEPIITVDNLKIAEFIYLLQNKKEIRDAITTLIMKAVLILGRFTPEHRAILDVLRSRLLIIIHARSPRCD